MRRVALALDIGGSKVAAALIEGPTVLAQELVLTPAGDGPDAVLAAAKEAALLLLARPYPAPVVVGVASAGLVSGGVVRALSREILPGWAGVPVATFMQEALALPVIVLNDAQAAAYGEAAYGAGRGRQSLLFVTVSTGVGGGLVLGGRLWCGASGMAGHVGQMGGRALERVASGTAIAARARGLGHALDAKAVVAAAVDGQAWARELVTDAAAALATTLADVQFVVDPEVVVLGGGVGLNPDFARAVAAEYALRSEGPHMPLLRAELGAAAGLVGAAAWALEAMAETL